MINPFIIMKTVEECFYIPRGSLVQRKRTVRVANARAVAMYLLRTLCHFSYLEIGEYFERDHSGVMHNCNKIVKMLQEDREHYVARATIALINSLDCKGPLT